MKKQKAKQYPKHTFITVKQLYDACQLHRYLILTFKSGRKFSINCKIAKIAQRISPEPMGKETEFISYQPCGINEYIEHKTPFC